MSNSNRRSLLTVALLAASITLAAVMTLLAGNGDPPEIHAAPRATTDPPGCVSPTGVAVGSDSPVVLGQPVHFTTVLTPSNVTVPTYQWDFGGAATDSGATTAAPVVTYTALGDYTAWVTVTGYCGGLVTDSALVSVVEAGCISPTNVAIDSDSPVALGEAMHFTAIVTPSDTTNPAFEWDFGGSALVSGATTATPIVTYTTLGDYTVQVTVTGDCDAPVVDSVIVSVESRVYLPLALRDHASGRYAVIVGIADYPGTANDLNYTDDDATEFRQMLLSEGGFQSSDILMLLDSAATVSAIQNAITDWLDSREGPADLVVFFFSGHGSREPDVSGDEDDPYDEYLVAYDSMIRDDVLDSWLDTLESSRQVVIVDSCYSGGLIAASSVQEGLQCRCLPSQGEPLVGVLPGDGFARDVDQSGRLVLTASAETEYSYESSGLQNGVFTYYLLDALDDLTADTHDSNGWISAEEAYDYLYPLVRSYLGNLQSPQMSDGVSGEVDLTQP